MAVRQHGRAYAGADGDENRIGKPHRRAAHDFSEQGEMRVIAERNLDARETSRKVEAVEVGEIGDPAARRALSQSRNAQA